MNCSFDFAAGRTDGNFCGRRRRGWGPADGVPAAATAAAKIEKQITFGRPPVKNKIGSGRPPVEKQKKSLKIFIQVNIGQEDQKSGIRINDLPNFYEHCKKQDLEIVGLMCIPPANKETTKFFKELYLLSLDLKLRELSMGMSSDYINAAKNGSTFLRIGSGIFGKRNN